MSFFTSNSLLAQRHLTIAEIAARLQISTDTVRRLFSNEPGVIVIQARKRGTRTYKTIRVPEAVAERVYRRLANGG